MSKIASVLKEEIQRLARKELRSETLTLKRASAQHRRDIAELKRQTNRLTSRLARTEKLAGKEGSAAPAAEVTETLKFSAKGLRSQRTRLGLSAADYAKLVGVTQLSIYNWERSVSRPRQEWLKVLVSLRNLPKKEALARLEKFKKPAKRRRRRS